MTLKNNALLSVDSLLNGMQLATTDFPLNFMTIYNSSADASAATVVISSTGITVTVVGGANAHANTITFAAQATLGALITAIEALAKGWIIARSGGSDQPSSGLYATSVSCLLVANIKTLSGLNTNLLHGYINWASQMVADHCGREFISAAYTKYYDGNGMLDLLLDEFPLVSVTSLKDWDRQSNAATYTYTEHDEYEVDISLGSIYLMGGFMVGRKNYQVVYTAGYAIADLPSPISEAAIRLIKVQYNRRNKEGIATESASGQISTQFDLAEVPNDIKKLLSPYVKMDRRFYA